MSQAPEVGDAERKYTALDDRLYDYLLSASLRESGVARRLREETAGMEGAVMQIAPDQGQLMALLVRLLGARQALEIGTFTGYSALCVAEALPAEGRLVACDRSAEWTAVGERYWEEAVVRGKIDLRLGKAMETLDGLLAAGEAGRFDFAFIDADKPSYDGYYERCLQLVRPGGLVAIDNVLWKGKVAEDPAVDDADTAAIRALNAKVAVDERVWVSMLPVSDGLSLVLKK